MQLTDENIPRVLLLDVANAKVVFQEWISTKHEETHQVGRGLHDCFSWPESLCKKTPPCSSFEGKPHEETI